MKRNFHTLVSTVLLVVFLVGIIHAARQAREVLDESTPEEPLLFDHGLTPIKAKRPEAWTNEHCGSCHKREYEQWEGSLHAMAATNENYLRQIAEENGGRQSWCVNCHAPLNPMSKTQAVHRFGDETLDVLVNEIPDWVSDGVDCITCHVRDHHVLATKVTKKGQEAHPMKLAPELGTAEFCSGCHQFQFKASELPHSFYGVFQQASLEELCDFNGDDNGTTRCQDCHMADGGHEMPGGYSDQMLKQSVDMSLDVKLLGNGEFEIQVILNASGAGHRIPGGEFFRYFTLRTWLADADGKTIVKTNRHKDVAESNEGAKGRTLVVKWPKIESIRRVVRNRVDAMRLGQDLEVDTRLYPGENRIYRYRVQLGKQHDVNAIHVQSELHYHILDEHEAATFNVPLDETHRAVHARSKSLVASDSSETSK